MTLETMSFNIGKLKSKDSEWFQSLIAGYVESGVIPKPTAASIKKVWESKTGQTIKNK